MAINHKIRAYHQQGIKANTPSVQICSMWQRKDELTVRVVF